MFHYEKDEHLIIEEDEKYYEIAIAYKEGSRLSRNWIKAAYYFNKNYIISQDEASFNQLMEIYQFILDNLEIENGNLVLKSIVDTVGEDSIDYLVDILIYLQNDLEAKGYETFIQAIFDVDYWIPITNSIIESNQY